MYLFKSSVTPVPAHWISLEHMNHSTRANGEEDNATATSQFTRREECDTAVQSKETDTITLNRNQVESILQLINQVASEYSAVLTVPLRRLGCPASCMLMFLVSSLFLSRQA